MKDYHPIKSSPSQKNTMRNADRIAIRITADEYRIGDAEALEHIMAIVGRGEEDALIQIAGILAETGRAPNAVRDDLPPGYDPESGEFGDYDDGDPAHVLGEGVEEMNLIDACLDDLLKHSPSA